MKELLVVLFIGLALPRLAFGQAQTAQPPRPGPEVQKLAYYLGTWKSEGELKTSPSGPTAKFSGTDTCEWFAGGFHLICRGEGTGPRGKFTELYIDAYDADAKVYTYYRINSLGDTDSIKMTLTGNTYTATWEETVGGKPAKGRYIEVLESPTSHTFKIEYSVAGGPWTVIEEGRATKVK